MAHSIKISIVTPSFNQAQYLEEAICSVLSQSYPNLEYIVVEDCSTDNSREIISKYGHRISFLANEKNMGLGFTLNKGFQSSCGEIMGWLNADDLYFPWTLATISAIFTKYPHVEWLTTETPTVVGSSGKDFKQRVFLNLGKKAYKDGLYLPDSGNCITQESTFWRRSLWEKTGGYIDKDFLNVPDFELWSRFWEAADLYSVPVPLGIFRWHANQKSSRIFGACCEQAMAVWRKHNGNFPPRIIRLVQSIKIRVPVFNTIALLRNKKRIIDYSHGAIKWYSLMFNLRRMAGLLRGLRKKVFQL
ncbi:MAG: glycosyltransferase [Candidatus Omnitrophica bacterium]|nr:glycosyltransferase [Candidatus Omnitrophota bacterium]MDD5652852.1 glycosyltransferase [Candidatus Omnitrophota bacterium]